MTVATDVMIVGAGPYGLSLAAHLRGCGLECRIIGKPMQSWLAGMPKGMLLKSPGFATTLSDPEQAFPLHLFCKDNGIPYQDVGLPIRLETFSSYGLAFQKRLVPQLEDEKLTALSLCPGGFELRMESGNGFIARKVVLAIGIDYFRHMPQPLAHLPAQLCSHSAEHHDLSRFRNREVAVFGSGASAIDIAVLLHEAGAKTWLIARKPMLNFGLEESPTRPFLQRVRMPMSGVGAGWKNRICTDVPWLYRYLPDRLRLRTVKRFLGPAGGWFMKDRAQHVPRLLGYELQEAGACDGRVQLRLAGLDGGQRHLSVDHVITATGHQSDVHRLPFLGTDVFERLRLLGSTPRLSAHFESSVSGLYFAGPIAGTSFGPVMRFVAGADFTSRRIAAHLARSLRATPMPQTAQAIPRAQH